MQILFLNLIRSIKYGFQNFIRNVFLTVSTTVVMVLTLFGLGFFIIVNQLSSDAIEMVQNKVDISINLKDDVKQKQIEEFQSYLTDLENVETVEYRSKKEAKERFEQNFKDFPGVQKSFQILDKNPLPASVVVQANNTGEYQQIVQQIKQTKYQDALVKDVSYNKDKTKDIVSRLTKIINWIQRLQILIMVTLGFLAVALTYNSIRLALYSYRTEIEIMRLIGASNFQIKAPFVIQGILFGVFGTIISSLILFAIVLSLPPGIERFFDTNLTTYIRQNAVLIVVIQLAVGILLGAGSSAFAINRYLKV